MNPQPTAQVRHLSTVPHSHLTHTHTHTESLARTHTPALRLPAADEETNLKIATETHLSNLFIKLPNAPLNECN